MENQLNTITVQTQVQASPDKVWKAWNEPEHITKWCQASPDWHVPYADNDLKVGGKFKTTMAAKDGSMQFDFEGVYTTVEPNAEIKYKMADGREVHITFREEGDSTQITESFDPEGMNDPEMQRTGWQAILDNFKAYVEEGSVES